MNSSMVFALLVIGSIVYWLIGFVQDLDDDVDVKYGYNEKRLVAGEESLDMTTLSLNEKRQRWKNSNAKKEMLALCPNFIEMRYLVEDRIEDNSAFKKDLLKYIDSVQREFMSGKISADGAKAKLLNY